MNMEIVKWVFFLIIIIIFIESDCALNKDLYLKQVDSTYTTCCT